MIRISKKNLVAYAFFLFWPFFSLIYAIINYKAKYAKNIVWLFTCFYGFTFVIPPGMDSNRYRDAFLYYHSSDLSFSKFFQGVLIGEQGRGDYYEPILSFIIAQFTEDYRYLFLAYAIVFGFFFSRSIWLVIDHYSSKLKPLSIVFLIFLVTTLPIWYINGVRFYTACMIFCYAVLSYYLKKQKKYIILIFSTPFVHLSFFIPLILLTINWFLDFFSRKQFIYIVLFVFGAFLSNFEIDIFLKYAYLVEGSETISDRIDAYTYQENVEAYFDESKKSWFMKLEDDFWIYSNVLIILFLLVFNYKKINEYKLDKILFIGVIIFSATTIFSVIPSMQRFFTLSSYILIATLILFYQKSQSNYWINTFSPVLAFLILFLSFIEFRVGWATMNISLLFFNPLLAPFFENTVSILDFYEGNV